MTTQPVGKTDYSLELPGSRTGRPFRDAGIGQISWFSTWVILALVFAFGGLQLVALACFLLSLLALPGEYEPYYLFWRALWRSWQIRRNDDQVFFQTGQQKRAPPVAIPYRIDDFFGQFAILHHQPSNTDTMFWQVDGWQFANADPEVYHAALMRVADVFRMAISQTEQNIAYAFINGQRPFDPTSWADDVSRRYLHPDFNDETGMSDVDRHILDNLTQAFGQMVENKQDGDHSAQYLGLIAVTVPRPDSWKSIAKPEEFDISRLRQSVLYRMLETLGDGLEGAGFKGVTLMDKTWLHRYVYNAWNVVGSPDGGVPAYYRLDGVDPAELPHYDENRNPRHVETPFPVQSIKVVRTGRRYNVLQMDDDSYHCVINLTRFQRSRILPAGAYPLTAGPHRPWVLYTQTCNTSSAKVDKWILRQRRNFRLTMMSQRGTLGTIYEEQEDRDRADRTRQDVDRLYLSGSKPIRANHLVVVSATSLEGLEESYEDLVTTLRREQITYRRVSGRARLLPAFLLATLGPRL